MEWQREEDNHVIETKTQDPPAWISPILLIELQDVLDESGFWNMIIVCTNKIIKFHIFVPV